MNKMINKLIKDMTENGDLKDLYQIAKNSNILVLQDDLGRDGGFYFYEAKTKTIIINNKLSYYHKLIVLAHEIAHAVLHPFEDAHFTHIGIPKHDYKENEANLFACKLLNVIGFWENENLCIYQSELTRADLKFIEAYKKFCYKGDINYVNG